MTPAEKEEARRIMAVQASTLPAPNEKGQRDIGPLGAWERARSVRTSASPFAPPLEDVPITAETTGMGTR